MVYHVILLQIFRTCCPSSTYSWKSRRAILIYGRRHPGYCDAYPQGQYLPLAQSLTAACAQYKRAHEDCAFPVSALMLGMDANSPTEG